MTPREDFSVVMQSLDEEENIPILAERLAGIADVVLADGGSTDRTVELARAAGWRVITDRPRFVDVVTRADVDEFSALFGFEPTFTVGAEMWDSSALREWVAAQAVCDFVFYNDCDEHPTFDDLGALRDLLPGVNSVRYPFIHQHNEDGTPAVQFVNSKFYRRSACRWDGRVHEVVVTTGPDVYTDLMRVDHHQRPKPIRAAYCAAIEYAALKRPTEARALYYLARQYAAEQQHDKAIATFPAYFDADDGNRAGERAQAYTYLAGCHAAKGDARAAIESLHLSMIEDSSSRDAFYALGKVYHDLGAWQAAITWLAAALTIPRDAGAFYLIEGLYGGHIHRLIAKCYTEAGLPDAASAHMRAASEYDT
jgi:glycosyltransferase involved in cell wall biosynthesis